MTRAKQKINVILDIPDEEYASKLLSEAVVEIIAKRIEKYPVEQQISIYDKLIEEIKARDAD
ncbi:hypothetical protein [Clostridiisalibacter paucivorans]|uniref:hypothetical protein n=1 Tax=Clostridiisalibacter paucivorans TaxID=408753 RepID=UPI00047A339D|nr:hypothetical protein [Clostridiisalibacter paucivorans]